MEANQKTITLLKPTECFVGSPDRKVLSKVFRFVDFGDTANKFLQLCGTQKDPSPAQIATKILDNPSYFYDMCGETEQCVFSISHFSRSPHGTPDTSMRYGVLVYKSIAWIDH